MKRNGGNMGDACYEMIWQSNHYNHYCMTINAMEYSLFILLPHIANDLHLRKYFTFVNAKILTSMKITFSSIWLKRKI